jgi:hypothetical protein
VPNLRRFFTRQGQSLPVSIDCQATRQTDPLTP